MKRTKNHSRWIAALALMLSLTAARGAWAGSATPGRITSLHWGGGTLRIGITLPDGPGATCPAHPEPPYYGARMTVPDDKKLLAAVLLANGTGLLVNAYWDDNCAIHGLDVFK